MPFQNISNDQLDKDFREAAEHTGDTDLMTHILIVARNAAHKAANERGNMSRAALFQLANLLCGFHIGGAIEGVKYTELCESDGRIKARYRAYFIHSFTYQYCMSLIVKLSGLRLDA